jgi:hypothetical protein
VPLLDLAAGDMRVAGYVVDVQLDRRGARVFHIARVASPAAGRHPVETADHRDVHALGSTLKQAEVAVRASVLICSGREVGQRFGETVGAGAGEPRVPLCFPAQLLLEQGEEHNRADPGGGEPPYAVQSVRKRGCGGDQRVPQR